MTAPDRSQIEAMRNFAETLRGQFEQLVERGPELARSARDVQITEKSRDGLVQVTVDSRGNLINLDLDPRIYRRPDARELADTIIATIRSASARAEEAVLDIFEPVVERDTMRMHLQGDPEEILDDLDDRLKRKDAY